MDAVPETTTTTQQSQEPINQQQPLTPAVNHLHTNVIKQMRRINTHKITEIIESVIE